MGGGGWQKGLSRINVQDPLPVDGDSIYEKDVDAGRSSSGGFDGEVVDAFNDLHSTISDSSATNPKTFVVVLNRPIDTAFAKICAKTGNFSNVKITFRDGANNTVGVVDDSSNDTKYQSQEYATDPVAFCNFLIEFHTADAVSFSFIDIKKSIHTHAQLMALQPDGTVTFIGATAGGNLKISLEEFDDYFNSTPLPVADFGLWVSRGIVTGIGKVNKYGRAIDGIQVTPTDVWDRADAVATQQIWIAPTAARIHTLISTSIQDDGTPEAAGSGAQVVRVWYLPDWNTAEAFEDVVMNGTAGVVMNNAAVIIHRMKVIELGATYNINAGTITATAAVDGTVTAQISIGTGQTLMSIYGVPSIQTLCVTGYKVNAHNTGNPSTVAETDFEMLVNERPDLNTLTFLNKSNLGLIVTGTSSDGRKYDGPPFCVNGPAIIKFQAITTLADTEATAEFDGYLVTN